MYILPNSNDLCLDCGFDTIAIGEYYSVHPEIWAQTGISPSGGMLCISCLENRLGYTLTSNDFTDFPINYAPMYRSHKLISRLSS